MRGDSNYKVKLIPFQRQHVTKTVEWVNDEELKTLIDRSPEPVTLDECYRWYDEIVSDETKIMFALETIEGKSHVGNCGLFEIHKRSKKAKLWVYIGVKSLWRQGMGRDVLAQLIDYGFNKLNLNRLYLYVVKNNIRAQKFYESAGFIKEGVFRQDAFLEGKFEDTIYYSMLREEYDKRGRS